MLQESETAARPDAARDREQRDGNETPVRPNYERDEADAVAASRAIELARLEAQNRASFKWQREVWRKAKAERERRARNLLRIAELRRAA